MSLKNLAALALTVLLSPALGCGEGSDKKGPRTAGQKVFVMVPKGVHPYYEPCREGFQDAAKKYGVKADYVAPPNFELPQQVKTLENLIARKVDGIALSAVDNEGLISVIDEATKAGIRIITFDAPAPATRALTYIGTANEQAGYVAGKTMAELMGKKGKLAILQGGLAAPNLNERYEGVKRAIKELAPEIELLTREDTKGKVNETMNKTESLLQAHPDLKGILGVSAEACPGAAPVIKEQKKVGKVFVAGFDDLPETLDYIRNGTVAFCVTQETYKMGWLSVERLIEACEGKPLPRTIDTSVIVVTTANLDTYKQDMKKGLGAAGK